MAKNGLLTIAQAAREKGVSRQAIQQAIKAGRLAVVQVGSIALRIEPHTLAKFEIHSKPSGRTPRKPATSGKG